MLVFFCPLVLETGPLVRQMHYFISQVIIAWIIAELLITVYVSHTYIHIYIQLYLIAVYVSFKISWKHNDCPMKDIVAVAQCNTLQEGKINLNHNWFQSHTHSLVPTSIPMCVSNLPSTQARRKSSSGSLSRAVAVTWRMRGHQILSPSPRFLGSA